MTGPSVTFENVVFRRPGFTLSLNMAIEGGMTALMGASGSGKSTVLDLLAGFEAPQEGRILVGGQEVTGLVPHERPVSLVFQDNNLFAQLDARANVGLGISPRLRLSPADEARVAAALAETGLKGKEGRRPSEMSGGERQRTALARASVRDRKVLLLDEPFAALGPAMRQDMGELVRELAARHGMTIVLVTHDPAEALRLADQVVFLQDGKLAAQGPADRILRQNDGPVGNYLGERRG